VTFALALPWWAIGLAALTAGVLAIASYARAGAALQRWQRVLLAGLRVLTSLALLAIILRPVRLEPGPRQEGVVPILIDVSASMSLPADGGRTRLESAMDIARTRVVPALGPHFVPEVLGFGDRVAAIDEGGAAASARESRLDLALEEVRRRSRERRIPGVVVVSDGVVRTRGPEASGAGGPPVFAIPVGRLEPEPDREVFGVSIGDARVQGSLVDLSALVAFRGGDEGPAEITIAENGRPIDVRRVAPSRDGAPQRVTARVAPARESATVYAVRTAGAGEELTPLNNQQSVLAPPAGPPRVVLIVEGGPGFEHGFLKRSLEEDPGLRVDAVVRKGRDAQDQLTWYVQAASDRAASLTTGFPASRAALFAYDAVVLANVEAGMLSRDQASQLRDFVTARGGGLVFLGTRSFDARALAGTPLEDVVPVELVDRAGGLRNASRRARDPLTVALTADGEEHPVMRLGATRDETRTGWAAAPALSAVAALGDPRPGATLLATSAGAGGVTRPLVAVHRYGRGRAVVFGGEASWRWKMMKPAGDLTYDNFWRQTVRWAAADAYGPVAVNAVADGPRVRIVAEVRDAEFVPARDARVRVAVLTPSGDVQDVPASWEPGGAGTLVAEHEATESGVYQVTIDAKRGERTLGSAQSWALVGGADGEFSDPRRDDETLRRVAEASGGRLVAAGEAERVGEWLRAVAGQDDEMVQRDVWHRPWVFLALVAALAAEWTLRRRWGLR
jgi:uncharacterized membrane protein